MHPMKGKPRAPWTLMWPGSFKTMTFSESYNQSCSAITVLSLELLDPLFEAQLKLIRLKFQHSPEAAACNPERTRMC